MYVRNKIGVQKGRLPPVRIELTAFSLLLYVWIMRLTLCLLS